MIFTEDGFHLKSGFMEIVLSQEMVFPQNLESQKSCLHQRILYIVRPPLRERRSKTVVVAGSSLFGAENPCKARPQVGHRVLTFCCSKHLQLEVPGACVRCKVSGVKCQVSGVRCNFRCEDNISLTSVPVSRP